MDVYILQAKSVFFLSLWKTYVGPALSVPYSFSYFEMLLFTISAAMLSAYVVLHFTKQINALLNRILPKQKKKPEFKSKLRVYVKFWQRYGFYGVMLLTPILIGIPIGVWLSARLGVSKVQIMKTLFILCIFWASLSYYIALAGTEIVNS